MSEEDITASVIVRQAEIKEFFSPFVSYLQRVWFEFLSMPWWIHLLAIVAVCLALFLLVWFWLIPRIRERRIERQMDKKSNIVLDEAMQDLMFMKDETADDYLEHLLVVHDPVIRSAQRRREDAMDDDEESA